jgi:colanic acid biosynthesis glycosyl transferase WcaI
VKVLVVSQYFPPEPGATQNRLGAFVDGLRERGHRITVVCEQPCHPAGVFHGGFGRRPVMTERGDGLTVHRLLVAASPRKTTARRLAFYGSFAVGAAATVALQPRHDVALMSSPPLPGVLTGAAAARARGFPLVVDVRDLWPAAAEALGELSDGPVLRAFERAERRLYRAAAAVTATTRPFCAHIDRVAGRPISVHVPNGALDTLVRLPERPPPPAPPFVVGYAGNLGIAQGLGGVLEAAERLRDAQVRLVLLGDGPERDELARTKAARSLDALELRPSVPVELVGDFLQSCHALLVPLGAHPALADFIPSKLYDAMAVGRPALVAARGEAAALVQQTGAGLAVPPEDGAALAEAILSLAREPGRAAALGAAGRRAAAGFARSRQLDRLEHVLTGAAAGAAPR